MNIMVRRYVYQRKNRGTAIYPTACKQHHRARAAKGLPGPDRHGHAEQWSTDDAAVSDATDAPLWRGCLRIRVDDAVVERIVRVCLMAWESLFCTGRTVEDLPSPDGKMRQPRRRQRMIASRSGPLHRHGSYRRRAPHSIVIQKQERTRNSPTFTPPGRTVPVAASFHRRRGWSSGCCFSAA